MDIADISVALLAGGLETRLGSLAAKVPKALLDVAGRPFIDHQLGLLRRSGIERVVLCLGYLGEQVEAHVGDGSVHGLSVRYSYDGPRLLGTGGALRRALPLLGESFFVMYGDSYTNVDFRTVLDHFLSVDADGCMTVFKNDGRWDRSNVQFEDGRLLMYDKQSPSPEMRHIDYGVLLLRRGAVERIPAGSRYDLADLLHTMVIEGRMVAYEVAQRFYEIGSRDGLAETRARLGGTGASMSFAARYLKEAGEVTARLDVDAIERLVTVLAALRERQGRLFVLGVGGSAANASHAVNDFRKLCGIEAYTPTDNVSELTARVNDDGWETVFVNWLRVSRLSARDMVLVFSVGGGDLERSISPNLVRALQYAQELGTPVGAVVGREGGYAAKVAEACVIVPTVNPETVTPHAEAFQAVIWHLLVSHPALKTGETKWESVR
jgi:D-sedoheptulose 7-phosphate isomerase